jgi:hypothetical protein
MTIGEAAVMLQVSDRDKVMEPYRPHDGHQRSHDVPGQRRRHGYGTLQAVNCWRLGRQ